MNAFDDAFLQGFSAALAIARATAGRIAAGDMHVLRREMAAEALRSFAEEARDALAPDLGLLNFEQTPSRTSAQGFGGDQRTRAASLGYVGEACPDCANFTLVRNGTCLKCDTCGSTTGCS